MPIGQRPQLTATTLMARTIETRVTHDLMKLGLQPSADDRRRVLAVPAEL